MLIFKVKLFFYPLCEVKCGLQNGVSTVPKNHGHILVINSFITCHKNDLEVLTITMIHDVHEIYAIKYPLFASLALLLC